MSALLTGIVFYHPAIDRTDILTMLALADQCSDDGGFCWPSVQRLALKTRVTNRQVIRSLNTLEAKGLIERHQWRTEKGRRSAYQLHLPPFDLDSEICGIRHFAGTGRYRDDTPESPLNAVPKKVTPMSPSPGGKVKPTSPGVVTPMSPKPSEGTIREIKDAREDFQMDLLGKPTGRRTRIDPDMALSPAMRQYATDHGIMNGSVSETFERFKLHHQSKGTLMVDWLAAYQLWVRNDQKFREEKERPAKQAEPRYVVRGGALFAADR